MFPLVCQSGVNQMSHLCHRFPCATSTRVHTPPTWTLRVWCSVACCFTSVTPSSSLDSSRGFAFSKVMHACTSSFCWSFCRYAICLNLVTKRGWDPINLDLSFYPDCIHRCHPLRDLSGPKFPASDHCPAGAGGWVAVPLAGRVSDR